MSPVIVGAIVVAVIAVALALQILAGRLQSLPLDQRRADPLIDVSSRATGSMRPAELHQLTTVIANSILSDASFRNELQPILDGLAETAPATRPTAPPATRSGSGSKTPTGRRLPGGRSRRSERVEQAIADLEDRFGR